MEKEIKIEESLASLISERNRLHKENKFDEAKIVQDKINEWGQRSGKVYRIM